MQKKYELRYEKIGVTMSPKAISSARYFWPESF